ncbi:hypothetical protein B0H11DRAFT_279887 [Mycena galericulata]|nr:hypothetical protein B0H11DRAFT_279887 [Mycena galericulata]
MFFTAKSPRFWIARSARTCRNLRPQWHLSFRRGEGDPEETGISGALTSLLACPSCDSETRPHRHHLQCAAPSPSHAPHHSSAVLPRQREHDGENENKNKSLATTRGRRRRNGGHRILRATQPCARAHIREAARHSPAPALAGVARQRRGRVLKARPRPPSLSRFPLPSPPSPPSPSPRSRRAHGPRSRPPRKGAPPGTPAAHQRARLDGHGHARGAHGGGGAQRRCRGGGAGLPVDGGAGGAPAPGGEELRRRVRERAAVTPTRAHMDAERDWEREWECVRAAGTAGTEGTEGTGGTGMTGNMLPRYASNPPTPVVDAASMAFVRRQTGDRRGAGGAEEGRRLHPSFRVDPPEEDLQQGIVTPIVCEPEEEDGPGGGGGGGDGDRVVVPGALDAPLENPYDREFVASTYTTAAMSTRPGAASPYPSPADDRLILPAPALSPSPSTRTPFPRRNTATCPRMTSPPGTLTPARPSPPAPSPPGTPRPSPPSSAAHTASSMRCTSCPGPRRIA